MQGLGRLDRGEGELQGPVPQQALVKGLQGKGLLRGRAQGECARRRRQRRPNATRHASPPPNPGWELSRVFPRTRHLVAGPGLEAAGWKGALQSVKPTSM